MYNINISIINSRVEQFFPGDFRERATPVPIPNTEVKSLFADGTALVTMWESRTLPGILYKYKMPFMGIF